MTMKSTLKNMLLIGMGVGGTLAFQKYSKPAMKEIEKLIDKTVENINDGLEEMM